MPPWQILQFERIFTTKYQTAAINPATLIPSMQAQHAGTREVPRFSAESAFH
jgi:hypothetical protein